jgi:hypothetical protein
MKLFSVGFKVFLQAFDFKIYIKPPVQLDRARLGLNFIKNIIIKILLLFSIKYVNPVKSYRRKSKTKSRFLSVTTGFFFITFERFNEICPFLTLIPNFPLRSFLGINNQNRLSPSRVIVSIRQTDRQKPWLHKPSESG